jgi:hypothetical protein
MAVGNTEAKGDDIEVREHRRPSVQNRNGIFSGETAFPRAAATKT